MDNAQVEVTQEDREAAAEYISTEYPEEIEQLSSIFARYRIAAEQRGFQAAKEEAERIAAKERARYQIGVQNCCHDTADTIATAISNMEPVK